MRTNILAGALVVCSIQSQAAEPLSLDSLKALVSQSAWNEIIEKAESVKPTERSAEWNKAVSLAAAEVLTHKPEQKNPLSEFERAQKLEKRFLFLKTDAAFQKRSEEVLVDGLTDCNEREFGDCDSRISKLSKNLGPSALMTASKTLLKNGYFATAPMLLVADAVKQDAKLCADESVSKVVVASFELPFDADRAKAARSVAFGACYKNLAATLKQSMIGASEYYLKNACKDLKAKKVLSELQTDLCSDVGE
jgi:hypothetical protein